MRRSAALLLAIVYLVSNTLAALLMVFFATFPFENQPRDERAARHWLIGAAVVMTVLALVILVAVVARRVWLSALAFALNFAVALVLLHWALGQSDHSDDKLLLSGFVVELMGLGAVGSAIFDGSA